MLIKLVYLDESHSYLDAEAREIEKVLDKGPFGFVVKKDLTFAYSGKMSDRIPVFKQVELEMLKVSHLNYYNLKSFQLKFAQSVEMNNPSSRIDHEKLQLQIRRKNLIRAKKLEPVVKLFQRKLAEIERPSFFEDFQKLVPAERAKFFSEMNHIGKKLEESNTMFEDLVEWTGSSFFEDDPDDLMQKEMRQLGKSVATGNKGLFENVKKNLRVYLVDTESALAKLKEGSKTSKKQPQSSSSEKSQQTNTELTTSKTPSQDLNQPRTYTVQRGDSLSLIAKKFNTTWNAIFALNSKGRGANLKNPDLIYPGQVLEIPSTRGLNDQQLQESQQIKKDYKPTKPSGKSAPSAQPSTVKQDPSRQPTQRNNQSPPIPSTQRASSLEEALERAAENYIVTNSVPPTLSSTIAAFVSRASRNGLEDLVRALNLVQNKSPSDDFLKVLRQERNFPKSLQQIARTYLLQKEFKESDWSSLEALEKMYGQVDSKGNALKNPLRSLVYRRSQQR